MNLQELNNVSIVVRLLLSAGVGCLIGMERESKNRPAGFRTYTLVSVGACLIMMTNQYIFTLYQSGDPSRLGAQVISGIGFLGAGTILVTKNNQVRGLTTAAGLWTSACVGLALGVGFYFAAVIVGIMMPVVMVFFQPLDQIMRKKNDLMRLYAHFGSSDDIDTFLRRCQEEKVKVLDMQLLLQKDEDKGGIVVLIECVGLDERKHERLITRFAQLDGVRYLEEV